MDGRLRKLVEASEAIVFFGGAGVSCESGIPDFRSTDGLYHQEYRWPPEEILSHDFFERRPEEFFRFYRDKMLYPQAEPNAAHLALARLEQAGKLKAVVTQNIDGLHQQKRVGVARQRAPQPLHTLRRVLYAGRRAALRRRAAVRLRRRHQAGRGAVRRSAG